MDFLAQLLTHPAFQTYVNTHDWVWPVCEMLHYFGMSLMLGLIGVLDLRILGVNKRLPIGSLKPFVPLAIAAIVVNAATGMIFVVGNPVGGPETYLANLSFQLKMGTLLLALVNLVVFRITGLEAKVYAVPAQGDAPAAAKVIAVISIACWLLVIFFGRLLMYNDNLLLFLGM
jgi:hypothetical protein